MTKLSAETNKIVTFNGDERIPASDGVGGTPSDGWIDPNWLISDGARLTFYGGSTVYNVNHGIVATGTQTLNAGRLYTVPIFVARRKVFTSIATIVSTPAAAGGLLRLGIRNLNPDTGQPTTLVVDSGAIANDAAAGVRSAVISQTLDPGWYYLQSFASAGYSGVGLNSNSSAQGVSFSGTSAVIIYGLLRDFAYAALPADESAQTYSTNGGGTAFPIIGIR